MRSTLKSLVLIQRCRYKISLFTIYNYYNETLIGPLQNTSLRLFKDLQTLEGLSHLKSHLSPLTSKDQKSLKQYRFVPVNEHPFFQNQFQRAGQDIFFDILAGLGHPLRCI